MRPTLLFLRLGFIIGVLSGLNLLDSTPVLAEIKLLGTAKISGETQDLSDLPGEVAPGIRHTQLGGISGIDFNPADGTFVLLPDRGPADGATPYACRFHRVQLQVDPARTPVVSARLLQTIRLHNEQGQPLTGSAKAFRGAEPSESLRFDPEGVRIGQRGVVYLSDEYGPSVYEFAPGGVRTRVFAIPRKFRIAQPSDQPEREAENSTGRQPNGGLEGLAINPARTKLYAAMQRPLIQDSLPATMPGGKRIGTNTRILEIDIESGRTREFLYTLDHTANGICEILAINDQEFLMLERDSRVGSEAIAKRVYKISLAGATDISSVETLPAREIPAEIVPVRKELFLDLLDPRFGLVGESFPEKVEGLCFGPDLPDGRRLLLVAIDNDFIAAKPIIIHAFALDRNDLTGLARSTTSK
ncbi:MAG: esterase-like activity of phytase family protein [Planctomycetes bacterium]|nr:esterase-like activity of phytase family protein [Planctomycetota bacterium]